MEKLEGKERGRNWLCEWSPRRKRLNPGPSHTLKPKEALLEIPGISYCRCLGPDPRELVGGQKSKGRVSFSKPGLLENLGAAGRRGDTVGRVKLRRA